MAGENIPEKLKAILAKPSVSILLEIYRTTHKNPPEPAYYSKLVEKCDYSRETTAKALAELEGLSLVDSEWEKIPASAPRRWVRSYSVVSEAIPHVENLAKTLQMKK